MAMIKRESKGSRVGAPSYGDQVSKLLTTPEYWVSLGGIVSGLLIVSVLANLFSPVSGTTVDRVT